MPKNVDDIIQGLSPARRQKVEARATQLIAEEMTLRELRKARKLTQVRVAKKLGITQDSVCRLEQRSDLLLSTLRKTVEAMGGQLSLVAEFPDGKPVVLLASVRSSQSHSNNTFGFWAVNPGGIVVHGKALAFHYASERSFAVNRMAVIGGGQMLILQGLLETLRCPGRPSWGPSPEP